jgi:hypothetical protein
MTDSQAVLAALERLEGRLERIETALEGLGALTREGPGLAAAAVDSLDDAAARLTGRGVDVDERLRVAAQLAERLTEPKTLATLEQMLTLAEAAPALVGAAGDSFDGLVARLAERGVDVDERLHILWNVAERLTAPEALRAVNKVLENVDTLQWVLESGIFDESAVHVVGSIARALSETDSKTIDPVGTMGLWRAMSDPGIRRSLGVAVEFGRRFGAAVGDHSSQRNGRGA